jgi:group I intron endonuclease
MIIYKITNKINGKYYIGKSIKDKIPFWRHVNNAERGKKYIFSRAIRKYGKQSFSQEIICHRDCVDDLNMAERYYIKKFRSNILGYGYNMTEGGDGGDLFSSKTPEERKEITEKRSKAISKAQIGIPRTDKAKKALSKAQKLLWCDPIYREKQTIAFRKTIEKTRLNDPKKFSRISKKNWENAVYRNKHEKKYIIIYPDGHSEIIQGMKRFCRENNLNSGNMIAIASGKRRHHKGFRVKYYNEKK